MEGQKHFSHTHNLFIHRIPEGEKTICSGCNLQGAGVVYACWECRFFLDEKCFLATRSFQHPSHPAHPLTLFPTPTYPSGSFICDFCSQPGSGFSYGCSSCDFDLHLHCATNPAEPEGKHVEHNELQKAHPDHPLKHLSKSPYTGSCMCDVCGQGIEDDQSLFHCDECSFDLHVECASLAQTVKRDDHEHPLTLYYDTSSYATVDMLLCEVCQESFSKSLATYYCADCNYGTHVKCVNGERRVKDVRSVFEEQRKFQQQMFKLQNQMHMQRMTHEFIMSCFNNFCPGR